MRWAAILCLTAGAAGAVDIPDGCVPFLTVQDRACEVDIFLRCDHSDGVRLRIQNYAADGLQVIEEMSADWSLLFSVQPARRSAVVVRRGDAEPASLAGLVATGESRFDYPVDYYVKGPVPFRTRLVGTFRLTGGRTVIDGQSLHNVELRMRVDLPEPIYTIETIQMGYASADLNIFLEGAGTHRIADRVIAIERGPVSLAQVGDAGFLDVAPRHGCYVHDAGWGQG